MEKQIIKLAVLIVIGGLAVKTIKMVKEYKNEVEVIEPECDERD